MKIGRLRHRITLQEWVGETLDSDGARVDGQWLPIGPPVSAEIRALSGSELIAAAAVASKVSTRITIRYRPGITAGMRAAHRGVAYNIEAVIPDPDSGIGWLALQCSSGVNEG
jgi:SPP1 family predicted phage head-tail adaptor